MTIIVWDGKTLACDGQVQQGDMITSLDCNKLTVIISESATIYGQSVLAFGTAGDLSCQIQLIDKMKSDLTHDSKFTPVSGVYAIIITQDKVYELYKTEGAEYCTINESHGLSTMGSGHVVANIALSMGCDARSAVVKTCELSSTCGGTIRTWSRQCV